MSITSRREAYLLLLGDVIVLAFSLWATLLVRSALFPDLDTIITHFVPFSFLFAFSVLVFLIAGLYEGHTLLVKSKLPQTVFYAQIANIAAGAIFFFLVPYFGIQPKTNLFIYLFLSTTLVSAWRLYAFPFLTATSASPALLVGEGEEFKAILGEVNGNNRYSVRFVNTIDTHANAESVREAILANVGQSKVSVVVLPFTLLRTFESSPEWDALLLSGVRFVDLVALYEDIFGRVALPLLDQGWFLKITTRRPTALYDICKRVVDVTLSVLALIILSPLILFVSCLLLFGEGAGAPFIFQKRLGKDNREITIIKFRTMLYDDGEDPEKKKNNRITKLGHFLRRTQIDEVPQFWNVLRGDISLIGPRPEIPHFVHEYAKNIPYYETRHLIPPGISGWAQIKHASPPKFKLDIEATKDKLSYDLYYLKHRSFFLDMEIILRTVKILISRVGR